MKISQSFLVSKNRSNFWSSQTWQHFLIQPKHYAPKCNAKNHIGVPVQRIWYTKCLLWAFRDHMIQSCNSNIAQNRTHALKMWDIKNNVTKDYFFQSIFDKIKVKLGIVNKLNISQNQSCSQSPFFLKRPQKYEKISVLFWRYWVNVKTSGISHQISWPSHNFFNSKHAWLQILPVN